MFPQWEQQRISKLSPEERIEELESELRNWKSRSYELEQRVDNLRVSRRILMNLLEKVEGDKAQEIHNLTHALELERQTKRRLLRKNSPAMLALVQKPFDVESYIKEHDPKGEYEDIQAMRNPKPYLDEAKADIKEMEIEENRKTRRR